MIVGDLDVDVDRLREICAHYGVARLDVFGSVGRGEASPGSDVDVLYELNPGARLGWGIEDLVDELSEVLRRSVDLVSRRTLHPPAAGRGPCRGPGPLCGVRSCSSAR